MSKKMKTAPPPPVKKKWPVAETDWFKLVFGFPEPKDWRTVQEQAFSIRGYVSEDVEIRGVDDVIKVNDIVDEAKNIAVAAEAKPKEVVIPGEDHGGEQPKKKNPVEDDHTLNTGTTGGANANGANAIKNDSQSHDPSTHYTRTETTSTRAEVFEDEEVVLTSYPPDGEKRTYRAGRFSRPSLAELRARNDLESLIIVEDDNDEPEKEENTNSNTNAASAEQQHNKSRLRFSIMPQQDVSALHDFQIFPGNKLATFQVASQFNCLEQIDMGGYPEQGVTRWAFDHTQGPACCLCTGPAMLVRNYFTGQSRNNQINNLADVTDYVVKSMASSKRKKDSVEHPKPPWEVIAGYTKATGEGLDSVPWDSLDRETCKSLLRIGVHADTQVTSCGDWGLQRAAYLLGEDSTTSMSIRSKSASVSGKLNTPCLDRGSKKTSPWMVTHALCSGCAVAYNHSRSRPAQWEPLARIVLEACYEATFYTALETARRHEWKSGSACLFLTSIGGGVFGNKTRWINDAILQAVKKFHHMPLDVRLVSFGPIDAETKKLADAVKMILRKG
ncbi:unnamed protein product [Amoebophrya sp. A25]|nr:unnamed protein product [Amoebophrya sp. A25]|eukprot:GSA25T00024901001.1